MGIDGIRKRQNRRVQLDEFFDQPTFVDIKVISPYARAQIREVLMAGFDLENVNAKGQTAEVKTKTEGMADRDMKVRALKLTTAFAGTNMTTDGVNVTWDTDLWAALDDADPGILGKVLTAIDEHSGFTIGGETDPTSISENGKS